MTQCAIANHSHKIYVWVRPFGTHQRGFMSRQRTPSDSFSDTITALAAPAQVDQLGPVAKRFLHALRLIALHDRLGRDPVPELAEKLGSVDVAAKALILAQAIGASWPEDIAVSRFCCRLMSHDEATIGAFVDAAARGDRAGFEAALSGLIRADRTHRLWESALALAAAELRSL